MAQQINLYTPIFRRQKQPFSAVAMVQALVLVVAGTLAVAFWAGREADAVRALAAQTERQAAQQRDQLIRLAAATAPENRSRLAREEIERLTAQLAERRTLLEAMQTGALGNSEGFSRYLAAFARQVLPGVWLVGIQLASDDDSLSLRGRVLSADRVPAYIRALSREEVMRGRTVTALKLTARDVPAPKAAEAGPARAARTPERFVEFELSAPRAASVERPS